MFTRVSRGALACALLTSTALTSAAHAQDAGTETAPLQRQELDENGVNPATGGQQIYITELSIGPNEPGGLRLIRGRGHFVSNSNLVFTLSGDPNVGLAVTAGLRSIAFDKVGGVLVPSDGSGAAIVQDSSTQFTLTLENGTVIVFNQQSTHDSYRARGTSIAYPNGQKLTLHYSSVSWCTTFDDICGGTAFATRLEAVTSSLGYIFQYNYAREEAPEFNAEALSWKRLANIRAINTTVDPCAPLAPACTLSQSWPTVSYDTTGGVTDPAGNVWRYHDSAGQFAVRRPSSAVDNITITTDASSRTTSVARDGMSWTYNFSLAANVMTMTRTDPVGHVRTVLSDTNVGLPTSVTDEQGRVTTHQYDSKGQRTRTTFPEGNAVQFSYDTRGNVTEVRRVAKPGSGIADIVTSAAYPPTCASAASCNRPTSTTDERGNVTDYTYNANGDLLTVTSPAPAAGAARPQVRYTYANVTTPGGAVSKLQSISQCQTLGTCAGTADEAKTVFTWSNQLLSIGFTRANGTGTLSAATVITNDAVGNPKSVDGPLPGAADTITLFHDKMRRRLGAISPDPDGAGPLKRRAVKTAYHPDGMAQSVQSGTAAGTTDADFAAMTVLETQATSFDAAGRAARVTLTGSDAVVRALTQIGYDSEGRLQCTATRMNPATFASPPASACSLGSAGSFGPDRIVKLTHDAANHVTQRQVAFGTADQATEATLAYTPNGKLQSLKDAENNLTTYEYDGHDRLSKTRYPLHAKGANASSTTDFEQLGYDPAGNIVSHRLRDGNTLGTSYDFLDRPSTLGGSTIADRAFTFDNLGRLTGATFLSGGASLATTYDALGNKLTETGPQGTATSEYDLSGRRTKLTYPGAGLFLNFDYLVTGEMLKIRENGATSGIGLLATFGYDDLGRRTKLTRGNGAVTSYGYDPVSWLTSLSENLAGTAKDQAATFTLNPAGQIAAVTRTNDAYAWTGHGSGSTAGVANGLNQLTSVGGAAITHDARGNVTSAPGKAYAYDGLNQLTAASGASLGYDPLMRLNQLTAGAATTRFAYDGLDMIAEYDGADLLQRRFVFGPGTDEPLVQYEGSGTAGRSFFHADERGSIVAVSDGSGNLVTANFYDEYGKPLATNSRRFQYTGQMWLPEVGAYYYKARFYSPTLGRFLQTDPIGVEGGINLYAYVGNDPVNLRDPLGLCGVSGNNDLFVVSACRQHNFGMGSGVFGRSEVLAGNESSGGGRENDAPDVTVPAPINCGKHPEDARCKRRTGMPPIPASPPSLSPQIATRMDWCGNKDFDAPEGVWADACRAHDQCYSNLGSSKINCDVNLGRGVVEGCQRARVSCFGIGILYGVAVWLFGDESFQEGKALPRRR